MKILMIGPFPGQINGMTLANRMVSEGLIERGNDLELIITNIDKDSKGESFKGLNSQGKFNFYKVIWSIKPILKGIYKILFNKFDVVYITPAQSFVGFMKYTPFILFSRIKKLPCYLHFHGGFVRTMYNSISDNRKKVIRKYFNMSSGIIVLGKSLISMFDDIVPNDKIFVCENGVEKEFLLTEEEFEQKKIRIENDNKINILYLSNLMQTKGILELLEACKLMKEENIEFKLNIAGSIETNIQSEVKAYIELLKDNVEYHGLVRGNVKRELLVNSDIFCLPTYYPNEGQPISILEAMVTANAIVTTYQGGIRDIFEDGINGCVCKPTPESIISAIKESKKDLIKYSYNNYEISTKSYTEMQFVNKLEKIILQNITK